MAGNKLIEYIRILKDAPNSNYYDLKYKFTYNSNKIERSMFSIDEVLELMQYRKVSGCHTFDDIVITKNSLDVFDHVINILGQDLNMELIGDLYNRLNKGIGDIYNQSDLRLNSINNLIIWWNKLNYKTIKDIIKFHLVFMKLNILQNEKGRIGRLILLKQCIEADINPLLICNFNKIEMYNKYIISGDLKKLIFSFDEYKI